MNIAVVDASVAIRTSQPSQKNSNEQSNEFNKTFSSCLNQNSMESSSEKKNDEQQTTEMMDELACLMVPLPLLNLTPLPMMEGEVPLVQASNLELEMEHPLIDVLNVQADSIEKLDVLETGETLDKEQPLFTETQSSISSELKSDEHESVGMNLKPMDSMLVDHQDNLDEKIEFKKVINQPLNQEKTELQHSKVQDMPLELDSFEEVMKASQPLVEKEAFQSIQTSLEDDMNSVQESMIINNSTVVLKDVTTHEAPFMKSVSDANYFKWANQSEIMSNLKHQMSILKENDYTTLQLKLYPQHLGSISVELKMKNGVLNAHVLVEHAELKSVIEQEFHQINLDGTTIEQLNVEVNAQSQQQSQSHTSTKTSRRFFLEDEASEELEAAPKEIEHKGYLNLTV